MAYKLGFIFLPVTVLLLLGLCSADQALIDTLCSRSNHRDLCESLLSSDGRSQACSSKPCIAEASCGIAIKNASNTHISIQRLINNGVPAKLKQPMDTCSEIYADAIAYLNRAIGFIQSSDLQDGENTITTVGNIAKRREATFPNHPSPLAPYNDAFYNVADVVWELVDMCNSP